MRYVVRSNTLQSQAGFGLLEVLMASTVLTIVGLGSLTMFNDLLTRQETYRFRGKVQTMENEARGNLRSQAACLNSLSGLVLTPAVDQNIADIKNENNAPYMEVGHSDPENSATLQNIRVREYTDLGGDQGRLTLELGFQSAKSVYGSRRVSKRIRVNTRKNIATNAITNCAAEASVQAGPWTASSDRTKLSTPKRVGIGTTTPQASLDVKDGFIRGELNCRVTETAYPNTYNAFADCASDEYVIGGGGECLLNPFEDPNMGGFFHRNMPKDDLSGWIADCFINNYDNDPFEGLLTRAYAICCKK